jgi:hypothetical protein
MPNTHGMFVALPAAQMWSDRYAFWVPYRAPRSVLASCHRNSLADPDSFLANSVIIVILAIIIDSGKF